jgi:hypothetical protein
MIWGGYILMAGMGVLLRCLDSGIGGRSGEWIRLWGELFGDLDGGLMRCYGGMVIGLLECFIFEYLLYDLLLGIGSFLWDMAFG